MAATDEELNLAKAMLYRKGMARFPAATLLARLTDGEITALAGIEQGLREIQHQRAALDNKPLDGESGVKYRALETRERNLASQHRGLVNAWQDRFDREPLVKAPPEEDDELLIDEPTLEEIDSPHGEAT